ncbi:MAG: beta-lactamase family protein [Gammaproteobacteria bacterium]|nr:beta-lactamase family protein [Gammaproteobacteria bacterium]
MTTARADDDETIVPTSIDELREAISGVLEEHEVPAVGIAIVDETGPVWIDAIGKASLENDVAADENSMFRIGSTSKMFVALSVLKLVEEGRLSLDDRIADLVPDIEFNNEWEDSDPVRVVHLLEHTTGWDDIHLLEYAHNDPTPATLKAGLDLHPHSRVSRWTPGTRSSYCNSGPPVAAYIVQIITGQDFEEYVQENFLDPMGMDTMTYRLSADVEQRGVTLYDHEHTPQDYWHIIMRPSGSINASASDMAKMVYFFVNRGAVDGQQLVSTDSIKRMETVASTSAASTGQQTGYALHNYSSTHKQWIFRSHNGGVNGGLTELSYLPEASLGYAFMINSGNGAAFGDISDLVRNYLTRNLDTPSSATAIEVTPAHESLAGMYKPINPRQEIGRFMETVFGVQRFWFEDGKLRHKGLFDDETKAYVPIAANLFKDEESGIAVLSAVDDPLAGPVLHLGTLVLQPVSAVVAYGQLVIGALWGLCIAISLPYLLIWGVRRWRGKITPGAAIRIRVWPLLAGISALVFVWMFSLGFADPFELLGKPTLVSVSIMLATLAFAVFAVLGVMTAWRERHTEMNRVNYWYSTVASSLHFLVALFLLSFGIIGLMTWA